MFVLQGSHLVFKFLRGKSLEIAALVTLLARLPVNYHQLSSTIIDYHAPFDHVNDSW